MANQFEIYKCELCGNVIEVLFAGSGGPLSCCGQPMKLMADKANRRRQGKACARD